MSKNNYKNISIRGRIAFTIKCLQIYVNKKYTGIDFSPVLNMASKIVDDSNFIDESAMAYMEIIPEYLYEFDNYEDAEFEYISNKDFNHFKAIIPSNDSNLNQIMKSIYELTMEYCYEAMEPNAPRTIRYIRIIEDIFKQNNLPLPDISNFEKYTFESNNGWGDFIPKEDYL